jgi:hypothetical protein
MNIKKLDANYSFDGNILLIATISKDENIQPLLDSFEPDKYELEISKRKRKRSLDANSYAWLLINELANVMRISKDETYLIMLKRYGQSQLIKLLSEGLPILLRAIKYYEIVKEVDDCTYVKVFTGSSEYDSREMAVLIDGIVSECEELGINTMTPAEIERLKGGWKVGNI